MWKRDPACTFFLELRSCGLFVLTIWMFLSILRRTPAKWNALQRQSIRALQFVRPWSSLLQHRSPRWNGLAFRLPQRGIADAKKELKKPHYCSGCGIRLQFMSENDCGYIPRETLVDAVENGSNPICQRCHRVVLCSPIHVCSCASVGRWTRISLRLRCRRRLSRRSLSRSTP